MRALILAALLVASPMALAGCQTLPPGYATADEKAALTVERSFAAVLVTTNAAIDAGRLTGADAAKASDLLAKAREQVLNARALYDAGQIVQSNLIAGQAQSTIDALKEIAQ